MVNFPKRLAEARKSKKLSQEEFAKIMGTTKVQISRYETGERAPDTRYIAKLTENFKIDTNWLITGNGEMFLDQREEPRILEKCDEVREAFLKLPAERQRFYYHKIIAESLG